jgi:hypothetical protein
MDPEVQEEYERGLHALRQSIIDQQEEEIRIAKEKALELEKRRYISNMEKRLAEPSSSAHWHEMRELMTNVSAHTIPTSDDPHTCMHIHRPFVLVLDDPVAPGLDPHVDHRLIEALRALCVPVHTCEI